MQKPVILTADDDPEVLRAVERDLKTHYEEHYRVLRAESGRAALDLLRRLQQRNDNCCPVACGSSHAVQWNGYGEPLKWVFE
jgi:CheY-like chemotaxis protein